MTFMHSVVLDQQGSYVLLWTPRKDDIVFEVQVSTCKTHGRIKIAHKNFPCELQLVLFFTCVSSPFTGDNTNFLCHRWAQQAMWGWASLLLEA